jgi:enterobactin synthetase component D / holo-[acyl-carrier protein] synthase
VLEQILPEKVIVVATEGDLTTETFQEEEWILRQAVESRRREFATARACAREALVRLGYPLQAIPAGPHGNPLWPAGVVGSISHCDGYRVAAVARERDFVTIGIDVEPNKRLTGGVLDFIASADELEWVHRCFRDVPAICWDRLLFSIKETVYKAWFHMTSRSLGFKDAAILVDTAAREFSVELQGDGFLMGGVEQLRLSGHWLTGGGHIATAIAHSAS